VLLLFNFSFFLQGASPVGNGTPAQPPPLVRPADRGPAPSTSQPANRESVKRNLEADFPDPANKRHAADMAAGPSQMRTNGAGSSGNGVVAHAGVSGGEATHKVADLNPYVNKYNIKVSKRYRYRVIILWIFRAIF
jgi:hypothetical protein